VPERIHNNIETELSRDLGLVSALAIGVGTMIAAGIFSLSGLAVRNVGSAAILSFGLAAIVALFTALTYCEFVSIYPNSGEGYLYARKTLSSPMAFLVGFSLFLGYSSSCAFYLSTFSSYFSEFIWHSPIQSLSAIIALALLTVLNIKGTKESGHFQVAVTVTKVALLLWFVAGGLGSVDPAEIYAKFSNDVSSIASTATLVFITFFGFSAIAASAGEISNPVKTVPRAIFISMGVVTVLYTMVVLVIIAANLASYDEAAMGRAAEMFLGSVGGLVIVGGGLFSMVSATNASIMAGSRVSFAMSQFGHLPKRFGVINRSTKTPIAATVLVGAAILIFVLAFSLKGVADFANAILLIALIMVNGSLIVHRRKYPHIERPFRVPLVPLIPILGILSNLYLLVQSSIQLYRGEGVSGVLPVAMAVASLGGGIVVFLLLKGEEVPEFAFEEEPYFEPISIHSSQIPEKTGYRILVTISNPANVPQLLQLANAIASERGGEIIGLRVAVVPEQLSPNREDFGHQFYVTKERPILEFANKYAKDHSIPFKSQIDVGHNASRSILQSASDLGCDLIIMGWKGFTSKSERILGEIADTVVSNSPTDIMLVKMVAGRKLENWLLPTAGGKHAICAERYAASIVRANQGSLTFCSVVPPSAGEPVEKATDKMLMKAVRRVEKENGLEIKRKIIRSRSVTEGIVEESVNYDAVMVGATEQRFRKMLFGSIPEIIAKDSLKTVVLVKKMDD
jgi:amino acid transporter/nucleotide-binding universal stress UspA family protein